MMACNPVTQSPRDRASPEINEVVLEEKSSEEKWDHGWELYSSYSSNTTVASEKRRQQQRCSQFFDASRKGNKLDRIASSSDRTLIPLPAARPIASHLPLFPAERTDPAVQRAVETSSVLKRDSTCPRRSENPPHQQAIEPRWVCRRGRANWISFSDDPSQDATLPYDSQPSSPSLASTSIKLSIPSSDHNLNSNHTSLRVTTNSLFLKDLERTHHCIRARSPRNPNFSHPISSTPIASVKRTTWIKMMNEKRAASIDSSSPHTPDELKSATPASFATATTEMHKQDGALTPVHPHLLLHDEASKERSTDSAPDSHADPEEASSDEEGTGHRVKKDFRFWIIFSALMLIAFIAALDMTMISTALPAIVSALPPSTIAANWVTSAFLLPMVASQPIFGGLSCSIGRKLSINSALIIFLVGSVVCATAKTFLVLVVGRGVQGLGGGGIHAMCEIIMSDLTTLRERGLFFGLIALIFAVAGFAAPVLGGAFGETSWPWIFWINLPIGAVALVLLVVLLNIKVPLLTGREKWQKLDLVGNAVLFGSVTAILIGVTEGGIKYSWSAWQVWVPLIVGLLGMGLFLVLEWVPNRISPKPVFPLDLFTNRTAAFAYLQTFLHGVIFYGVVYMVPIYFQSIKDRSPLQSAIWSFPLSAPSCPLAIVAGLTISLTGRYRYLILSGWVLMAAGVGWMTHWHVQSSKLEWAFSQLIAGAGIGILFPITLPPIQAALPASRLESATAAYAFTRTFGAVWGITAATTIFSTQTAKNLRPYADQLTPLGLTDFTVIAFSESLRHLPEPLQGTVKAVYAKGISDSFWLFVPLAIIGFMTTWGIRELPLPDFIKSEAKLEQKEDAMPALGRGKKRADLVSGVLKAEVPSTLP